MPARPRLSLCIPTYNRAEFLEAAVLSGLGEAAGQAPGTVEVLVCDNASSDATAELMARLQAAHPDLRCLRSESNQGFDLNYLRCVEEARGEFVWVLGDDDEWLCGSAQRVLDELAAGADACLCLSQACDLNLNPVAVLSWYLDPAPPRVWSLRDRGDLVRYFDACARNAGAFAFISVGILRRERFLQERELLGRAVGSGYVHLWGMMAYLRRPLTLHYIPEALVRNRMSDLHAGSFANADLFGRWKYDLMNWCAVADAVFGDDEGLCAAFSRILGRNHHNTIVPGMRKAAPSEAAWLEAKPLLVQVGFPRVQIAAVELAHQVLNGGRLPMPTLDPAALSLVDLPLVARGAERVAVLALGGLQDIMDGSGLLARFKQKGWAGRLRILCPPECAELLDGFELQCVEPGRYALDAGYRGSMVGRLLEFAPELAVNLDPQRGVQADDLVTAALPAGAIAYELPPRGQDAGLVHSANHAYTCLVPPGKGTAGLLEALGLEPSAPALWPSPSAREEARTAMRNLGWDGARTLAVLVDHPSIVEDPAFQAALGQAADAGWTLLGIGGRGTYRHLEALLDPRGERAVNLAGALNLGSMAALLQLCGACLGGTRLLRSMAAACGCPTLPGRAVSLCPNPPAPSGTG